MDYNESDFLQLSGIQHFVYCKRQWALIHIEQQWKENLHTVQGNIFHQNAHDGFLREMRGDTVITRGLPVFSKSLGINGVCDVVEFKKAQDGIHITGLNGSWVPVLVEYKKGKPKQNECDVLQLAAQAVCLEEMLVCTIEKGYIFYGETRHRTEVQIDEEIRDKLKKITIEMHQYADRQHTPKVRIGSKCRQCSLHDICMPVLCKVQSAKKYISQRLCEDEQ